MQLNDLKQLRLVEGPLDGLAGWADPSRFRTHIWVRPDLARSHRSSTGWLIFLGPPGEPYHFDHKDASTHVYRYGENEGSLTTEERERELVPA